MKEDRITEYHCCCDCNKQIEVPTDKGGYETGCLDSRGKPNRDGGLCRCDYFEGVM